MTLILNIIHVQYKQKLSLKLYRNKNVKIDHTLLLQFIHSFECHSYSGTLNDLISLSKKNSTVCRQELTAVVLHVRPHVPLLQTVSE